MDSRTAKVLVVTPTISSWDTPFAYPPLPVPSTSGPVKPACDPCSMSDGRRRGRNAHFRPLGAGKGVILVLFGHSSPASSGQNADGLTATLFMLTQSRLTTAAVR